MMDLTYVLQKIEESEVLDRPFKHFEISDLFNEHDFSEIIGSPEILIEQSTTDDNLLSHLFEAGYQIIKFPGCSSDKKEYVKWHRSRAESYRLNSTCEGFGVVVRLYHPQSTAISQLYQFLNSSEFIDCISKKFGIGVQQCTYDAGIQKYLDGYEISPHPDIRKKALTFMVNINPCPSSEEQEYHTRYLTLLPKWNYITKFWEGNAEFDRAWVPWEWCQTEKQQRKNNSMVIFSPSNDTLHAVKASYDHLRFQRTQLYGNLWYKDYPALETPSWEDLRIRSHPSRKSLKKRVVAPIQKLLRRGRYSRNQDEIGKRNLT